MRFNLNEGVHFTPKTPTNDCVCRAVSIITDTPYIRVAEAITAMCRAYKTKNVWSNEVFNRTNLNKYLTDKFLRSQGFEYISLVTNDNKVTTKVIDAPLGRIIGRTINHVTAIVNRVVNDTWDTRNEFMYGFWVRGVKRKVSPKQYIGTYVDDPKKLRAWANMVLMFEGTGSADQYLHHRLLSNGDLEILYK